MRVAAEGCQFASWLSASWSTVGSGVVKLAVGAEGRLSEVIGAMPWA